VRSFQDLLSFSLSLGAERDRRWFHQDRHGHVNANGRRYSPSLAFPIVPAHRGSIPDFDTVIQIPSLSRAICILYVGASGEAALYLASIFALFLGFNEISG